MRLYNRFPTLIPSLISTVMLALAVPKIWPYLYFTILRWVVSLLSLYNVSVAYRAKKQILVIGYAAIAIMFNPIAPFRLNRPAWSVINVIAAVLLFGLIWFIRVNEGSPISRIDNEEKDH
jgi:phosphoglycerol transferase MdoB-like AlkP superfamily enzyme